MDKEKNSVNPLLGYQEKFEPCSFHHQEAKMHIFLNTPFSGTQKYTKLRLIFVRLAHFSQQSKKYKI